MPNHNVIRLKWRYVRNRAEKVLTVLAYDDLGRLVYEQMDLGRFETEAQRFLATRVAAYWRQHQKPPGRDHISELFDDILEDNSNPLTIPIRQLLSAMIVLIDTPFFNPRFVIDNLFVEFKKPE